MEFSIASSLIVLSLSGLASYATSRVSDPLDTAGWVGNVVLILALFGCAALSLWSPGVALIAVVIGALVSGYNCADDLKSQYATNKVNTSLVYIFAPLAVVSGLALVLSGLYLFFAWVFIHFPLPFEMPYSAVSSVFDWVFQKQVRLFELYALFAYFGIACASVLAVYGKFLLAALKRPPQVSPPTPPAAASTAARSGVDN